MRFKIEPVSDPEEDTAIGSGQFTAVVACPRCGKHWKSTGPVDAGDPDAKEKVGARRVEMLAQLRNGCPQCSGGASTSRERQHGRLRSAWPGSRR